MSIKSRLVWSEQGDAPALDGALKLKYSMDSIGEFIDKSIFYDMAVVCREHLRHLVVELVFDASGACGATRIVLNCHVQYC